MYTTTAVPAERRVREMIPVSPYCHLVISALHLLKSSKLKLPTGKGTLKRAKSDKNDNIDAELLGDYSIDSFEGSHAELEVAAERLFTSPLRPQPLAFEVLPTRTPAHTVPPTPGMALELKVQSNLESLGSRFDIQIDQKMGAFQASMLEAFNSLREDFQKSLQKSKQVEVDQTSFSASKPKPSHSKNLDPSNTSAAESMDVDYDPDLTPRLDSYDSHIDDASGHPLSAVEEPLRVASTKPKKSFHSHKHYDVVPSSASDHYSDPSDDLQPVSSRPKKHSDKSRHKSRSRFLPSSLGEDQSPERRHRSPKPSGKSLPDQAHPHDPDPPYYREVALSDIPSQYAEEVDTF